MLTPLLCNVVSFWLVFLQNFPKNIFVSAIYKSERLSYNNLTRFPARSEQDADNRFRKRGIIMYSQEDLQWIWLCSVPGIGPVRRSLLLQCFGTVGQTYLASRQDYLRERFSEKEAEALCACKDLEKIRIQTEKWAEQGITVLTPSSVVFPRSLLRADPPVFLLYAKGDLSLLQRRNIGIVGSRKCTNYGSAAARYLAGNLARFGYGVVSGMAYGIDACAGRGALDADGGTTAVLGCGVDVCYPPGNRTLYHKIAGKGLLLSEYPPGTRPLAGFFPMRNRIIAALSQAVVIVEAAERSGALITVTIAADNGIPVMVVPGPIFSETSRGTNLLIRDGAEIILRWEDIPIALGDMEPGAIRTEEQSGDSNSGKSQGPSFPDETARTVWESVSWEARSTTDIIKDCGLPPEKVLPVLTMFELQGYIETLPNKDIIRLR